MRVERDESPELVQYLLSVPELVALCGDRIWGERDYPLSDWRPESGPCLLLKVRSGTDDFTGEVKVPSFQFKIYGASVEQSREVARVLHGAMEQSSGAVLMSANRETLPQTIKEPQTNWDLTLVYYRVMLRTF